jgi:phenylpyruvate tautomerase PptA (4-oxalocrotonate tautomerase family)
MPLYSITAEEGVLSPDTKAALAAEITMFHSEMAAVDKKFVKIFFSSVPKGDAYVAGEAAAAVSLTLLIRSGRTPDYKRNMLQQLWNILKRATNASDSEILLAIQEAPASNAMELGKIMPDL